ncbi:O-antigen ligase family protein [Leeuwenhoekiella sp. MAR_2009_132]|uniref:O-antigen ligase family protein n=1 Tax=Leeuwenhoekiella sp. MAR_2009_132 TaxID=1392489 RepID=UPI00068CA845|nr:O-antigen ligase family protein [Leeuwenhoekiella sp. MAR_2009_132]
MIVSERTYRFNYNIWLIILAVSLIFRLPATLLLILFVAYNLFFYKHLKFIKKRLLFIGLIASPFLLDLIFLWNNELLQEGLKHAEKRISMLLLPFFILTQNHRFNTALIVRCYAILTTLILSFCLIRFAVISPELWAKYLNGVDLWEMGYRFASSINMHAPALNLHVAFVVVINFYFLKEGFTKVSKKYQIWRVIIFITSIIILFYVNTRLAILNAFIGILLITFYKKISVTEFKANKKLVLGLALFITLAIAFVKVFPYSIEKFTSVTFNNLDKVGKLDDLENPEKTAYNGLVTRLSIWKSGVELACRNSVLGVGAADGKKELIKYFKETHQNFLFKYEFPVHNQYLDFWIKFGLLGALIAFIYVGLFAYIGFTSKQLLCVFFFILFATSNFVDDFLIRFDGIVFSALWLSIFTKHALDDPQNKLK